MSYSTAVGPSLSYICKKNLITSIGVVSYILNKTVVIILRKWKQNGVSYCITFIKYIQALALLLSRISHCRHYRFRGIPSLIWLFGYIIKIRTSIKNALILPKAHHYHLSIIWSIWIAYAHIQISSGSSTWVRFLSLARSKLGLCSANHRPGY